MKICSPTPALVAIIFGAIFCAIGGIIQILLPGMIKDNIAKKVVITEDSPGFEEDGNKDILVYTQVYLFNYINHEDYLKWYKSNNTKPRVQQVGPYTYRLESIKQETNFTKCTDCVEYRNHVMYHFEPTKSKGIESDVITMPNVPLRAFLQNPINDHSDMLAYLLNRDTDKPFVTYTVGQFLFEGYLDLLLNRSGISPIFGFLRKMNNSESPMFRVNTGKKNINELGNTMLFKNSSVLNIWKKGSTCDEIKGTDGSRFPPGITKEDTLHVFAPELCRSLKATFKSTTDHYGLPTYRFSNNLETLADSNMNPEMACFCYESSANCLQAGLANLQACINEAPLVASFPHFLFADFELHEAIDGLVTPNFEAHGTYIDVEPTIGVVLKIRNRIQTNLKVKPVPWFGEFDALPPITLPLFWMSQEAEASPQVTQKIAVELGSAKQLEGLVPNIVFGIGGAIGLIGVICAMHLMYKKQPTLVEPLKGSW